MFDPYYKWLGIPPEHQPPNHYRLLGLELFEADADVIQAAAERQMAHIQSYKIGPQSDLSQRVLNEIARAKVCLINAASKAKYDESLRKHLTHRQASQTVPFPPAFAPSAAASVEDVAEVIRPRGSLRSGKRTRNRNNGTAILLGCLGIALAGIAAIVFLSQRAPGTAPTKALNQSVASLPAPELRQLSRSDRPQVSRPSSKSHLATKSKPTLPSMRRDEPSTSTQPSPMSISEPPTTVPPKRVRPPRPNAAEIEQARSTITSPSETANLPESGVDLLLPIRNDASFIDLLVPSLNQHKLTIEAIGDSTWTIKLNAQAVASIKRGGIADAQFFFSWNDAIPDEAQLLRNAVLVVHGANGPEAIALRHAVDVDSPLLDLTKETATVPINVPLWGLAPRALKVEVIGLKNESVQSRFPEDGCASHDSPARLSIRDELPKAGIELSLNGIAPVFVRTKPIYQDFENKINAWTSARMKSLAAIYIRRINDCNRQIPTFAASIPKMKADLAALKRSRSPTSLNGAFIEEQINRLNVDIENAQATLARLQSELPILVSQQKSYQELFTLSERVHRQSRIQFRVFYLAGNCAVDLLHARRNGERLSDKTVINGVSNSEDATKSPKRQPDVCLVDLNELSAKGWEYNGIKQIAFCKRAIWDRDQLNPIVLGGKRSPNGIASHPTPSGAASVQYRIGSLNMNVFRATVGVADVRPGGPYSALTFKVLGDGKELWKSRPVNHWGQPQDCRVPISGVDLLEIRVECAGDATLAFSVWCEPRLCSR